MIYLYSVCLVVIVVDFIACTFAWELMKKSANQFKILTYQFGMMCSALATILEEYQK